MLMAGDSSLECRASIALEAVREQSLRPKRRTNEERNLCAKLTPNRCLDVRLESLGAPNNNNNNNNKPPHSLSLYPTPLTPAPAGRFF